MKQESETKRAKKSVPAVPGRRIPAKAVADVTDLTGDDAALAVPEAIQSDIGRFRAIHEDIAGRVADGLSMFLGVPFEEEGVEISPCDFGGFRGNLEKPSLTLHARFEGMRTGIVLNLPYDMCERLLTVAMGGRDEAESRHALAPAGLAVVRRIGERILSDVAAGWRRFSEGETISLDDSWTNPVLCRTWPPDSPTVRVDLVLRRLGTIAMAYSWVEMCRFAGPLSLTDGPTVNFGVDVGKEPEPAPMGRDSMPKWLRWILREVFNVGTPKYGKRVFANFVEAHPGARAAVLEGEHPQLVAAVLGGVDAGVAARILDRMCSQTRYDIMGRMRRLDIRQVSLLSKVAEVLDSRVAQLSAVDVGTVF